MKSKRRWVSAVSFVLAGTMILTTAFAGEVQSYAKDNTAVLATATDPAYEVGIIKSTDGYFYLYDESGQVKKQEWQKVDGETYAWLDENYRVIYKYMVKSGKKVMYAYDSDGKKFVEGPKSEIIEVPDGSIYYLDEKGTITETSGWYTITDGTMVYVGSNGRVTAKLTKENLENKDVIRFFRYNYNTSKWGVQKNLWKTIDGKLYYFNSSSGAATKMFVKSTSQYYKFKDTKLQLVKKAVSTIDTKYIYYFNSKGVRVKTSGWYATSSTTKVYVGKSGYVTAKFTNNGKIRRYYTYNYKTLKWVAKKSAWATVQGVDYYFDASGVARIIYNTKTTVLKKYKNGKTTVAKKSIQKLKNGKLYYFGSKGKKVTKAGWYKQSTTDKVRVGSKGYVTMKFSTKSGKLTKYDYKNKKWKLVKVTSYKIGSNTYYFNSNGIMAKSEIVGNSKTGYFYVDETGIKVTSKEIQMAVDFVIKRTNSAMTREEKLKACFVYLSRNYPYLRDYTTPSDASRFSALCIDMLSNNHGNCYRCAATFACVATVLGYDARVTCGKVTNLQGTGLTIHGWTELYREEDKAWVVYDVSMQRNWPARNYYHIYMKDYYPNHRVVGPRARLTVKNGKVNWRWLKDSELSGR